jgi:transcriptional regulator with PAS, ATPase and Fis domain
VIGRSASANLSVSHSSLSREHLALTLPELFIEDLESTNGTFVRTSAPDGTSRERQLAPRVAERIRPGTSVRLGALTMVLVPALSVARPSSAGATDAVLLDDRMREIHALIDRIAPSDIPVLLLGETGVGKELLAERVHRASPRAARPMLRLNCAALSEQLVESELFGYEKGAFTGATSAKPGLIETANGGTVMLDEVGDLRPDAQAKLLRVLEEGKLLRVGALTPRPVDVRFVSATHKDLERAVLEGTFRRDLYFRLAGVVLRVPPLRERPAEVLPLVRLFLQAASAKHRRAAAPTLSDAAIAALKAHDWPGNVRELRHSVERALLLCDQAQLEPSHFDLRPTAIVTALAPTTPSRAPSPSGPPASRGGISRERLIEALELHAGNQTRAAKALGVSRRTLVNWIERHGVARPRGGR